METELLLLCLSGSLYDHHLKITLLSYLVVLYNRIRNSHTYQTHTEGRKKLIQLASRNTRRKKARAVAVD